MRQKNYGITIAHTGVHKMAEDTKRPRTTSKNVSP